MVLEIKRRSFITGIAALFAAPAIVKFESLMPVRRIHPYLTLNEITREAIRLFKDSNEFLHNIDNQHPSIGSTLRIRLPYDYHVN